VSELKFSAKGRELIGLYERMVREGYERADRERVDDAFGDFELRAYKAHLLELFDEHGVASVLDYGCGGSDWRAAGFDEATGQSAFDYFKLQQVYRYEPARGIDERREADCVVSFDVLEHVFVSDVPAVLRDMFSCAGRLLVLNVACYPAAARLPNGENAHVTVRPPLWWKGMVDAIAIEYPRPVVQLLCSTAWRQTSTFPQWSGERWQAGKGYVTEL